MPAGVRLQKQTESERPDAMRRGTKELPRIRRENHATQRGNAETYVVILSESYGDLLEWGREREGTRGRRDAADFEGRLPCPPLSAPCGAACATSAPPTGGSPFSSHFNNTPCITKEGASFTMITFMLLIFTLVPRRPFIFICSSISLVLFFF